MPELPEVQTIVSDLNKEIKNLRIVNLWLDLPYSIDRKKLIGSTILGVRRRAKNILIDLDNEGILLIHLKMTGKLIINSKIKMQNEKFRKHVHLVFDLDDGRELVFSDVRKFGKVILDSKKRIEARLLGLGPEPLSKEFTFPVFDLAIVNRRRAIKLVLLDQYVISGIGNIYSDDILWKARIDPRKLACDLSLKEKKRIWSAISNVLSRAIKLRGSSISDYRDFYGKEGGYQKIRLVYDRYKEKCRRCAAMILKIKIGGRSSCFCPGCQK